MLHFSKKMQEKIQRLHKIQMLKCKKHEPLKRTAERR